MQNLGSSAALLPGTRLGRYEILTFVAAGGMGEVYRAQDPSLNRDIAVKVLPAHVAADAERRARFEREARMAAVLNHPNIVTIHSVEHDGDQMFITMELVKGKPLGDLIPHNGLPIDRLLAIAVPLANAVSAAHDKGITHRDLKPANVIVGDDGAVKVLDFGIAKGHDIDASPDLAATASLATGEGRLLGTIAYMSPEQAEGKPADQRSDVFSLGTTLYEMATGRRPFAADTDVATLAAIVRDSPAPITAVNPHIPNELARIIRRAMAKDPDRRQQSAKNLRNELGDLQRELDSGELVPAAEPTAPVRSAGARAAWTIAAVSTALAMVTIALSWRASSTSMTPGEPVFLDVEVPPAMTNNGFALSPDGRRLAFLADVDGRPTLHLRDLHSSVAAAAPVAGTADAMHLSWSPDGRSIAFFADAKLKRLDIASGAIADLAVATNGRGSTWSPDGMTVLFARIAPFGLWRVPSQGGEAVEVTTLQPHEIQHRRPRFLGVGSRYFCIVLDDGSEPRRQGLYLGNLDGSKPVHLDDTIGHAEFLPPDRILYYDSNTSAVVMQRIDLQSGRLTGERLTVAANVASGESSGQYSWANGMLAFQRIPSRRGSQLQWFSRAAPEGLVAGVADQGQGGVELSPDGGRAVLSRTVNGNADIYLIDTRNGGLTRLTTAPAPDVSPIWSADGRAVYFASIRDGRKGIWRKGVDDGSQERLVTDVQALEPLDALNDTLLLRGTRGTINTLLSLKLGGGPSAPAAISAAGGSAQHGQLSPDGRWLAYTAVQDSYIDVWMKRLDSDGPGRQVTTGGGYQPRWGSDGRTLYYVSRSSELMAMPMVFRADAFEAGAPLPLLRIPLRGFAGNNSAFGYDVTRDGRFLVNADRTRESPITVVLNWTPR